MLGEVLEKPVAHRGLHNRDAGIIENSPTAFRLAAEQNYAIECDLQLSGDDIPMVIHDGTLDRVTGQKGEIHKLSAGQIGRIRLEGSATGDTTLRFSELLKLVGGRVALAVELKPQTDGRNAKLAETAVSVLRTYQGPIAFISFNPELLTLARKYGFKGPTGIIVKRFVSEVSRNHLTAWQRFLMRHMLHYPKTRFNFIDCDHKALDLPAVRLFRRMGFPLATWTIKSQAETDAALKHCDQITFEGFIPKSG